MWLNMQYIIHSVLCGEGDCKGSLFIIISFKKCSYIWTTVQEKKETYQKFNNYNIGLHLELQKMFMCLCGRG